MIQILLAPYYASSSEGLYYTLTRSRQVRASIWCAQRQPAGNKGRMQYCFLLKTDVKWLESRSQLGNCLSLNTAHRTESICPSPVPEARIDDNTRREHWQQNDPDPTTQFSFYQWATLTQAYTPILFLSLGRT